MNQTMQAVAKAGHGGALPTGAMRHGAAVEAVARNAGEEQLPRFSLVSLEAPIIQPSAKPETYAAVEGWVVRPFDPEAYGTAVGIALEVLPVGDGVRRIALAGRVRCRIHVHEESHEFALPVRGEVFLQSGRHGYPILWKQGGTGNVWAEIDMRGTAWRVCKAVEAIPADSLVVLNGVHMTEGGVPYQDVALHVQAWHGTASASCPVPSTMLTVSPGVPLAVGSVFLAPVNPWPAWVRLAPEVDDPAELVPGACVGVRADTAGQARAWLPGLRVLEYRAGGTGPDLVRVVPDGGVVTAAVTDALDAVPGFVEVALVRVEAGVGHPMQCATAPVAVRVATFDSVEE